MNLQQLKVKFPNASASFFKVNCPTDKGAGSCTGNEEQQDANAGPVDHESEAAALDAALCSKFRVSIVLYVSDYRRRDPDGALSTIMDCITSARRRLV